MREKHEQVDAKCDSLDGSSMFLEKSSYQKETENLNSSIFNKKY